MLGRGESGGGRNRLGSKGKKRPCHAEGRSIPRGRIGSPASEAEVLREQAIEAIIAALV